MLEICITNIAIRGDNELLMFGFIKNNTLKLGDEIPKDAVINISFKENVNPFAHIISADTQLFVYRLGLENDGWTGIQLSNKK